MLNLFSIKEKKKSVKPINSTKLKKTSKHFPSSLREWKNSIYVYNKTSLKLVPSASILINNIIKSYFNLFNKEIETKVRTRKLLLRLRRLSTNKYYISNGGLKHTNNKVLINLFVFNRQKINYLLVLKNWFLNEFLKKATKSSLLTRTKGKNININLIKRLKLIDRKGVQAVKNLDENKTLLLETLNNVLKKGININTFKGLSDYTQTFYKDLIRKSLKKIKLYFFYKQLLYINKSKLNYTYLQYLKKQLEILCNKNVEFNIINLDRFYLDSDILCEPITTKISKNRAKIKYFLKALKNKVKSNVKNPFTTSTKQNLKYNLILNKLSLKKHIMNNIKYKDVTGFRLQVKGRLNRRFSASRSVKRIINKGSLSDIDSSYQGLSTVVLKESLQSNISYSKLNSKSRVGSFGVRGWLSGN